MSRHVPDERIEVMQEHLGRAIRSTREQLWIVAGKTTLGLAADLRAILDEVRRRRANDGRMGTYSLGKTAKVLMAMHVGESVEMEPVTQGALTSARRTARRRMENPDAVWHSRTQPNGLMRVTRMPDGTPTHDKNHNPAIFTMAAMAVGETVTLTTLKSKMHNGIKIRARRLMDNTEANWTCINLANGHVRCTRTR